MKWEGLSDVVLCGHSYGGMVISGDAESCRKRSARSCFSMPSCRVMARRCRIDRPAVREAAQAALQRGDIVIPPRPAEAFGVNPCAHRAWVDRLCVGQPIGNLHRQDRTHRRARSSRVRAISALEANPNLGFYCALGEVRPHRRRSYEVPSGHDVMVDMPERLTDFLLKVAQ